MLAPHFYSYYSVPTGRVIFEIGGVPIREELARDSASLNNILFFYHLTTRTPHSVLRQAASKLPTKMEFINRATPPRLGNLVLHPPKPVLMDPIAIPGSSTTDSTTLSLSS